MSFISQIKLPDGNTYDIKDNNSIGTHSVDGTKITELYLSSDGNSLIAATEDGRYFYIAATTDPTLSFLVAKTQ